MDIRLQQLSTKAYNRAMARNEEPRYRCVICWDVNFWSEGHGDALDHLFATLVDQSVYIDAGRRRQPIPVTDAGLCSTCWSAIESEVLVEENAQAL